jgi:hypothetical protein
MHDPAIFYVYVLFDENAIPRYVGKGRGNRWLAHDRASDPNNPNKNAFIRKTIHAIGEVPKVKICEGMTEIAALGLERLLINSIGRAPHGPLVNLTDNRNGPTSETIRLWHASRTKEERSASARKGRQTYASRTTPEQRSETARKNALSSGRDALSDRMVKYQASKTSEQRRENASLAGKSSALVRTEEHKNAAIAALRKYDASRTREQRKEAFKNRDGIAKATKEQLSEWGKKGAAKANAILAAKRITANKGSADVKNGPLNNLPLFGEDITVPHHRTGNATVDH